MRPIKSLLLCLIFINSAFAEIIASEKKYILASFQELSQWIETHLKPRLGGREIKDLLPQSGLSLYLTPHRRALIKGEIAPSADPFQDPDKRGVLTKKWRKYSFYPNDFPYLTNHIMLISQEVLPQSIIESDAEVLKDIFDLQSIMPASTLSFNHLAGNSLNHFHVHISPDALPIAQVVDKAKNLLPDTVLAITDKAVSHFIIDDEACQRGFYLTGSSKNLSKALFEVLNNLRQCTDFFYNLIFLPMEKKQHRVVLMVRWNPEERPVFSAQLPYKVDPGALELAGLMMIAVPISLDRSNLTHPYLDRELLDQTLRKTCDYTVLGPRALKRFLEIKKCHNTKTVKQHKSVL